MSKLSIKCVKVFNENNLQNQNYYKKKVHILNLLFLLSVLNVLDILLNIIKSYWNL